MLLSGKSSSRKLNISSLHLFDDIYKIGIKSMEDFSPTDLSLSFEVCDIYDKMRRYPLYIEGNPISYQVTIELPAFMNKEWVDKLGDI